MRIKNILFSIVALVFFSASVLTTTPTLSSAAPQADSRVQQTAQALDHLFQGVDAFTLGNGLRVILYKRGVAPVFAGAVVVRVGGTDEMLGYTGISHMFEHMAFKGTTEIGTKDYGKEKELLAKLESIVLRQLPDGTFKPADKKEWDEINAELKTVWNNDEFTREYERRGAVGLNATTDSEMTKYFVNLPRSAFEFYLKMESDRLVSPVMRQFYKERDVVKEERRMRFEDDPEGRLYEQLLSSAFIVHPYRNPTIGYMFDIQNLTASKTDAFRRAYYVPSNMVLALVGDVDKDRDGALIEKYFGRIPTGPEPKRPNAIEPEQNGERRFVSLDRASPQIIIAYRKPNYPHPDDPPLTIMQEMLTAGKVTPLYKELVLKQKVATSVGVTEGPGAVYPNLILFFATPRSPAGNQQVLNSFDKVIADFQNTGGTEEGLEIAKRAIAIQHLTEMSSNSSLALSLATSELIYNDWKISLRWFQEAMNVSRDDVKRVARQYLRSQSRTIALLENNQSKK